VLLTATGINVLTGASFNGKLLAQTDVNLQSNIIVDSEMINQYTLTYTPGLGGTILGDSPQFVLEGEDGTEVSAVADLGFVFVQWSDGALVSPRSDLNVMADITVEAEFRELAENEYVLTYTALTGGSIVGTSPQIVAEGEDGTAVTPVPNLGYSFVQWSDGSTDSPRSDLNVMADITVQAEFVADPAECGIQITLGALLENDLSANFSGEDLTYSTMSGDPAIMSASITAGNKLRTEALALGQVEITVVASKIGDPDQILVLTMDVVGHPTTVSSVFPPHEAWNPRFTQVITLRNDELCDAVGIRLLFTDLKPGIVVENQNGTAPAPDGRVAIAMAVPFAAGASIDLSVVYLSSGEFRPDLNPPTIEIQFVMADTPPASADTLAPNITRIQPMDDGRVLMEFESVPGTHYEIDYMNDFPGGEWTTVALDLLAGANLTQWVDQGPPATSALSGVRAYRVRTLTP
jgi:hypothetical protein